MSKVKRLIASLLVAINIITLAPIINTGQLIDEAYATNGSQVGSGNGDVTVSGSGTWATYSTNVGYRFWLMDEAGNFVSSAGVADVLKQVPPGWGSTREYKATSNVKIQEWTGVDAGNTVRPFLFKAPSVGKFTALKTDGFKGDLPRPIIAPYGGDYEGQGVEFRKWMTDGTVIVRAGGGGGGGVQHTYKPGGSVSTGGSGGSPNKPSGGGSTTGGSTSSGSSTTPTVGTASQQLGTAYKNAMATVKANKNNWTRDYAIQYVNARLRETCNKLCQGLTGTERRPIIDTMNSYSDMIDRELPYDFKTADASHLIDTDVHTEYLEAPKSDVVTEHDNGTLILGRR